MRLDNILNNKLKKISRSGPKIAQEKQKRTPEEKHQENLRYIVRLIERGDYNPLNKSHRILFNVGVKAGVIDRDANILRKEQGGVGIES